MDFLAFLVQKVMAKLPEIH